MKRFKKLGAIIFLSAYLIIGASLIIPQESLAAAPEFTPQIGIPGSNFQPGVGNTIGTEVKNANTGETVMRSDLIARYIAAFYNWGFSIVGVLAVLMLMAAGVIWLTSGGDSGKIGNAKKMIGGSLLGSLLLVGSWFLLNTINPNLTNLPTIDMAIISRINYGCCDANGVGHSSTQSECTKNKGTFYSDKYLNGGGQCEKRVCCTISTSAYTNCFYAAASVCSGAGFKSSDQDCAALPQCAGKIVGCDGQQNGESPISSIGTNYLYCYKNIIVGMSGKENEPCGKAANNGFGGCIKASEPCSDKNNIGGRDCDTGLQCCLKFDQAGHGAGVEW